MRVHRTISTSFGNFREIRSRRNVRKQLCCVCERERTSFSSLVLGEPIGEGSYGVVYRGVHTETGQSVAVKRFEGRRSHFKETIASFRIQSEADIHAMVSDCPSVSSFGSTFLVDGVEAFSMELCEGGDLKSFVRQYGNLNEAQLAAVAEETVSVLCACHEKRIFHGDVKASNFVIRSLDDTLQFHHSPETLSPGWLKAVDFGCSTRLSLPRRQISLSESVVF